MTPEIVDSICAREGIDAATRQLYEFIRDWHGQFIRSVDSTTRRRLRPETVVAIVPAALYKEYRRSGADGRRVREAAERLGVTVETVPLAPAGTLEGNAAILVDWLRNCPHPNVILVSLSKGSSDIKRALMTDAEAFENVSAWISVGGLLNGTPLAQWILSNQRFPRTFRALNRIRGVDFGFIAEVDRRVGGPLDFEVTLPEHLKLIHVLGFPLLEHATNWLTRILYRQLAADGPNDAFMLLKDALRWPGAIYPVWGADHYFRTSEDPGPLLERLLTVAASG
ncbi:MAG TPA: hypothetical protein VLV78_23130 [Thermoanaerobaculia bacterium]|nr:hypothetical protein [Thermoanaerobaculia bacterium]